MATTESARHRAIVEQLRSRVRVPSPQEQAEIRAGAIRAAREHFAMSDSDRRVSLQAEQRWLRVAARRDQAPTGTVTQRSGAGLASVTDISSAAPRPDTLTGYASVFNTWTEISSAREGWFMERVAPPAFDRTLKTGRRIVAQYDHGTNARVSTLPLGPVKAWTDSRGLKYDIALLVDASYVQDLLPAARAGLFGSSFRFRVIADEWRQPSTATAENPQQLAERTLIDVDLIELGPVLWPAYSAVGAVSVGKPKRSQAESSNREVIAIHHRKARIAAARDMALQSA